MDPVTSYRHFSLTLRPEPLELEPKPTESLSTGWSADELLRKGILNVINSNIELNDLMREEIAHISANIRDPELMDQEDGLDVPTNFGVSRMPISLVNLMTEIHQQLKKTQKGRVSDPEIIGGAVPRLLGEHFYLSYLQKRLGVSLEEARRLAAPFLASINGRPNDYDYRQWVKGGEVEQKQAFKDRFAGIVQQIIEKGNGPKTTLQTLKARGFQKLNYFKEGPLEYGMASFCSFGGAPLDCIVMYKTDRPYLFTRDRLVIVFHPLQGRFGQLMLNPELGVHDLPETELPQEITIAHQLAMILDTPSYDGINPYGFLAAMALTTKGWRTLKTEFFLQLWLRFEKENALSIASLEKGIKWIEENHLDPENPSARFALRFNILIFLIDHVPQLNPEIVNHLLEGLDPEEVGLNWLTSHLMKKLLQMLKNAQAPPQVTFAWFRIALGIFGLKNGFDRESISTNYGVPAFRIFMDSSATIWIPLRLTKSLYLIQNTKSIESIFNLLLSIMNCLGPKNPTDPQALFDEQWIHQLLKSLKQKADPDFLKLALMIEKAWIKRGHQEALSTDWHLLLPILLKKFPEELTGLKSRKDLNLNVALDVVLSPLDWILHLAASPKTAHYALDAIHKGDAIDQEKLKKRIEQLEESPLLYFSIHQNLRHLEGFFEEERVQRVLFSVLQEILPPDLVSEGSRLVPWILFILSIRQSIHPIKLEITNDTWVLKKGRLHITLDGTPILQKAVNLFDQGIQLQADCLLIFQHLFNQAPPAENARIPQESIQKLLTHLSQQPLMDENLALRIVLEIQNRPQGMKTEEIPIEWLQYLPVILKKFPQIANSIKVLLPHDFQAWMESKEPMQFDWIKLLLLSDQESFRKAGGRLWRRIVPFSETFFFDELLVTLSKHPQKIPRCLQAHGCINFNKDSIRKLLILYLRASNDNDQTRALCANYMEHTFPSTYQRKPQEDLSQFINRIEEDLEVQDYLEAVQECEELEWEAKSHESLWKSLMGRNYYSFIWFFGLSQFYNHVMSFRSDDLYNQISRCQQSVINHQVLFGLIKESQLNAICSPPLSVMATINALGLSLLHVSPAFFACFAGSNYSLHWAKTFRTYQAITKPTSRQKTICNLLLSVIKPLSQIGILIALLAAVQYMDNSSLVDENDPFKQQCFREVERHFRAQIQTAEWRDLGSKSYLLEQLQQNLCAFDDSSPLKTVHQIISIANAYQIGSIFIASIKSLKRSRLLAVTQNIAQGILLMGISLYSHYDQLTHSQEECLRKRNYTLGVLGDTRPITLCPKEDEDRVRFYMISICAFSVLSTLLSFTYGKHWPLSIHRRVNTLINRVHKNRTLSNPYKFVVNSLKSPNTKILPFVIMTLMMTKLMNDSLINVYNTPCQQSVEESFPDSMECQLNAYPALGSTPLLLGWHLCRSKPWMMQEMYGLFVGLLHFMVAGMFAIPLYPKRHQD